MNSALSKSLPPPSYYCTFSFSSIPPFLKSNSSTQSLKPTMIINLSPSPPSSIRFLNSKSPIHNFPLKPKSLFPTSIPSSSIYSTTLNFNFHPKNQFLHDKIRYPHGKKRISRTSALSDFGFGGFESAQSVLEAVSVLTAIIVVHESGHFLAARLQGIHVSKFAVGFGPVLAKFNANNVEYSIRAFPLGGYVEFPDEDPDSDIPVDDKNLLQNRPIFDRGLVFSAGVIANIVFAYAIIVAQVLFVGLPVKDCFPGVLVTEVRPFSAASRDGLLAGDVILAVNGIELPKSGRDLVPELGDTIKNNAEHSVLFKVKRRNQDFDVNVTPDKTGRIGAQLSPNDKITNVKPKDVVEAFKFSGREFWGLTFDVLDNLKQIFFNFSQAASNVSGPVAIIAVGAEVAKSNVDELYQFAAILNINLAVVNLLPLPALDGGSLALILVEAARGGRKIPKEIQEGILASGFTLVLALGLFLIVRDTLNLDFIKDLLYLE